MWYVVCLNTKTVIRAQRFIAKCIYSETIDSGWTSLTEAKMHQFRIERDLPVLKGQLEVLRLSKRMVEKMDIEHEKLI